MKILWHGVVPWIGTGYGQQTSLFAPRIRDLGHDVVISSWFGLHGAPMDFEGITVLPSDQFHGNITLPHRARALEPDQIIALMDAWVLNPDMARDLPLSVWVPVDHDPCPPKVANFFRNSGARPIAMSRFGERALQAEGLEPLYVPHGVDTNVFCPGPRDDLRAASGMTDRFVVGMVANNGDGGDGKPSRKGFPQAFEAFAEFHQRHPEALLYLHCNLLGRHGERGLNLPSLLERFGIPSEAVTFTDQLPLEDGLPPGFMAGLFNTFDVLLNASLGEGFGIPIVEAQACGTPVIVTDWTAMPELVGAGWTVDGFQYYDTDSSRGDAFFKLPDPGEILDGLEASYAVWGDQAVRDQAREFALQYDADRVTEEFWKPCLDALGKPREVPPLNRAMRRSQKREKAAA